MQRREPQSPSAGNDPTESLTQDQRNQLNEAQLLAHNDSDFENEEDEVDESALNSSGERMEEGEQVEQEENPVEEEEEIL